MKLILRFSLLLLASFGLIACRAVRFGDAPATKVVEFVNPFPTSISSPPQLPTAAVSSSPSVGVSPSSGSAFWYLAEGRLLRYNFGTGTSDALPLPTTGSVVAAAASA